MTVEWTSEMAETGLHGVLKATGSAEGAKEIIGEILFLSRDASLCVVGGLSNMSVF